MIRMSPRTVRPEEPLGRNYVQAGRMACRASGSRAHGSPKPREVR